MVAKMRLTGRRLFLCGIFCFLFKAGAIFIDAFVRFEVIEVLPLWVGGLGALEVECGGELIDLGIPKYSFRHWDGVKSKYNSAEGWWNTY